LFVSVVITTVHSFEPKKLSLPAWLVKSLHALLNALCGEELKSRPGRQALQSGRQHKWQNNVASARVSPAAAATGNGAQEVAAR